MDDKLFGTISTAIGLVIGWTLNELSFLFKNGRENKKVLNQILFTQLEIRSILIKTNLNELEKQITEVLIKKFPDTDITGLRETIGKLFYGFIQNELNNKFSNKIQELAVQYNTYITVLSQIDPFTTYSISSKDVILDYLGYVSNYLSGIELYLNKELLTIKNVSEEENMNKTFKSSFESIADQITPFLRETAIETIETDIKIISKKIGLISQIRAYMFMKKNKEARIQSIDIKKIEFYIDSVLADMK